MGMHANGILVYFLNRFNYTGGCLLKEDKYVEYPENLQLNDVCS